MLNAREVLEKLGIYNDIDIKPNSSVIYFEGGVMLISYQQSIIAVQLFGFPIFLGKNWDYSRTTGKHRNEFLGITKAEVLAGIKSGSYIVLRDL